MSLIRASRSRNLRVRISLVTPFEPGSPLSVFHFLEGAISFIWISLIRAFRSSLVHAVRSRYFAHPDLTSSSLRISLVHASGFRQTAPTELSNSHLRSLSLQFTGFRCFAPTELANLLFQISPVGASGPRKFRPVDVAKYLATSELASLP